MDAERIARNAKEILAALPDHVTLVAAAKTRTAEEVRAAVDAGVGAVGHNYVQEAEAMARVLDRPVPWHLIGHLQRNKARRATALFDVVETLDSERLAHALERHAAAAGKVLPVLIEVNSGREPAKSGVFPEQAEALLRAVAPLEHLRVEGLMTMAPFSPDPEAARPYFREMRRLFDRLARLQTPNAAFRHLSMGMSHTWRIAVEEGATIVRIGTGLFGERTG